MSEPFRNLYAASYDLLYRDKDYAAECTILEDLFRRASRSVRDVLDLGCGTGGHALELASRGYRVVGIDRAAPMVACARRKAAERGLRIEFAVGDMRDLKLTRRFDAALLMFAALGYQTAVDDILTTLRGVRSHLRNGGLLIFDVWYGPAVLLERPTPRVKIVQHRGTTVVRTAEPALDVLRQVCTVQYHVWRFRGKAAPVHTVERHEVRFFFPGELDLMLRQSGFRLLSLTAFPAIEEPANEHIWNVLVVAMREAGERVNSVTG